MSCSTTTTRVPAGEREAELGGAHRFLVGHAGDRLVQQQQSRLLHQQHPDLEPLLLAVRQQSGRSIGLRGELDQARASRRSGRGRRARAARGSSCARACRPSSRARDSRRPNAARTPSASGTCGRCRRERSRLRSTASRSIVCPKNAVPASGPRLAGDHVHHRRLAGAVRADDAAQFAVLDREREVVQAP